MPEIILTVESAEELAWVLAAIDNQKEQRIFGWQGSWEAFVADEEIAALGAAHDRWWTTLQQLTNGSCDPPPGPSSVSHEMTTGLETHEIRSREEFDRLRHSKAGVIVNVGTPTRRATAHRPWCEQISGDDFEMKVVDNGGQNGRYYYFLRGEDARMLLGSVTCKVCS